MLLCFLEETLFHSTDIKNDVRKCCNYPWVFIFIPPLSRAIIHTSYNHMCRDSQLFAHLYVCRDKNFICLCTKTLFTMCCPPLFIHILKGHPLLMPHTPHTPTQHTQQQERVCCAFVVVTFTLHTYTWICSIGVMSDGIKRGGLSFCVCVSVYLWGFFFYYIYKHT